MKHLTCTKKQYLSPQCEAIKMEIEKMLAMTGETRNYDGDNPRPVPTGESTLNPDIGYDSEEASARRWGGGVLDWD